MKKNILIIDDDKDVLSVLEDILVYAGFNVKGISQTDGLEAVMDDFKPDLLLMDYKLRGADGGELCHHIKLNSRTAHLPVIIISAYPNINELTKNCGCDAVIEKPFDLSDLISCVTDCIAHAHTNEIII